MWFLECDTPATLCPQAWAAMEEDLGLYFNARELRNRNLQAQVEVRWVHAHSGWLCSRQHASWMPACLPFSCLKCGVHTMCFFPHTACSVPTHGIFCASAAHHNAPPQVVLPEQLLKDPALVEQSQTLRETLTAWFETVRARPTRRPRVVEEEEGADREAGRMRAMGNADGVQLTREFFPGEAEAGASKAARPVVPDDFESEFDRVVPLVSSRSSS